MNLQDGRGRGAKPSHLGVTMPTICAQDLPTIFLCSEAQVRRLIEAGRLVPQEDGGFDESEVKALMAEKATTREALLELTKLSQEMGGYSEMEKS